MNNFLCVFVTKPKHFFLQLINHTIYSHHSPFSCQLYGFAYSRQFWRWKNDAIVWKMDLTICSNWRLSQYLLFAHLSPLQTSLCRQFDCHNHSQTSYYNPSLQITSHYKLFVDRINSDDRFSHSFWKWGVPKNELFHK